MPKCATSQRVTLRAITILLLPSQIEALRGRNVQSFVEEAVAEGLGHVGARDAWVVPADSIRPRRKGAGCGKLRAA